MPKPKIPPYPLELIARTENRDANPTSAVQYCVVAQDGTRVTYGDQEWVASGQALVDAYPGGHVEQRTVSITFGEWTAADHA